MIYGRQFIISVWSMLTTKTMTLHYNNVLDSILILCAVTAKQGTNVYCHFYI